VPGEESGESKSGEIVPKQVIRGSAPSRSLLSHGKTERRAISPERTGDCRECRDAASQRLTGDPGPCLNDVRIVRRNLPHDMSKRLVAYLKQKVKVIRHPAVRVQARAVALDASGNNGIQEQTVDVGAENVLLMISPQRDVIKAPGDMNAQSASHPNPLRQNACASVGPSMRT
jgi:hypothetical protein